jgi:hypothetical protein
MLVRLSGRIVLQFLSIVSGSVLTEPPQFIRLPVRLIKSKIPSKRSSGPPRQMRRDEAMLAETFLAS